MNIIISESQLERLISKRKILIKEDENKDVYDSLKRDKSAVNIANIIKKSYGGYLGNDKEAWAEAAFNTILNMDVYTQVSKLLGVDTIEFIKNFMDINKKYHVNPITNHYNKIKQIQPSTVNKNNSTNPNLQDPTTMTYSEELIGFLKCEEGLNCKPNLKTYQKKGDRPTIGWGHTGKHATLGNTITTSQADKILRQDTKEASACVGRIFKRMKENGVDRKITQSMFDALSSLAFNSGCGNLNKRGKTILEFIKSGKYNQAADKLLTYLADKPGFSGLKKRRVKEKELFCKKGGCIS